MSDGWREIGRVPYVIGFGTDGPVSRPLIVGADDGVVTIGATTEPYWRLDGGAREYFQRLFMEAERQAETWTREHAGGGE